MDITYQKLDLAAFRAEMQTTTASCTYLNHAAVAPLSRQVREATTLYLEQRGLTYGFSEVREAIPPRMRTVIAHLIGASQSEITPLQCTSLGINVAAQSLPLKAGDNVIFCDMEFPANVYPWMHLEQQKGVEARCIPHDNGGLTIEALELHADEHTRVVTTSSVQFLNGFRTDLQAIGNWCREREIYFVVDGIQSLGVVPMDVKAYHIDMLSCGSPKWLMGPIGAGFLYCRKDLIEQLTPPMAGCLSVVGWEDWRDYDLTFLPDAGRFELGGRNLLGMVGLTAAIQLLASVGIETIHQQTHHLTDLLIADLQRRGYSVISNLDPARRSAIVSFAVPGDLEETYNRLEAAGVVVSMRESYIRVSPHGYNTEEEIARVGQVLGDARH